MTHFFILLIKPFVTTPILKLMAELVQNRSQRLLFDVSSPNGILLFREASKMVCAYGSRYVIKNILLLTNEYLYFYQLKPLEYQIMKSQRISFIHQNILFYEMFRY